jgi:hypothetical protein
MTEELERLLEEEAPNSDGKTWAATFAKPYSSRPQRAM